jgi:hypothetical protein
MNLYMMVETYFFLDMAMNSSDHNKITMSRVNSREIINNNLVVEDLMNDDQLMNMPWMKRVMQFIQDCSPSVWSM